MSATPPSPHSRVAILVVNGFDRRNRWGSYNHTEALEYPWIDLCLQQVERRSRGWDYEVLVYDNSHLEQHLELMRTRPRVRVLPGNWVATLGRIANRAPSWYVGRPLERTHPRALDHLLAQVSADVQYVVTLDSDSFPVRDDWLDVLIGACERGAAVTGVYRDEMAPTIRPFVHVSGLCARLSDLRSLDASFNRHPGQDVGQNITEELRSRGREVAPLHRSNSVSCHFLMGGLYGDVIYHHGAGSRRANFWTSADLEADEQVRMKLRDAAFADLDHLIAVLRGETPDDLDLTAHTSPVAQASAQQGAR
jgi:hypothetical protein